MQVASSVGNFMGSAQGGQLIQTIGSLAGGLGGIVQAKQQTSAGNYNAAVYEQQAGAEIESQKLLELQKQKIYKSQIGTAVALYGKSGVKLSGSPLEVLLDNHANANLDLAIDRYNGHVKASAYMNKAAQTRIEAKQAASLSYAQAGKSFLSTAVDFGLSHGKIGGEKVKVGKKSSGSPTGNGKVSFGNFAY